MYLSNSASVTPLIAASSAYTLAMSNKGSSSVSQKSLSRGVAAIAWRVFDERSERLPNDR